MAAPTVLAVCRVYLPEKRECACVGVDSSVLAGALGYVQDIVSHWLWHCTTCYYLSVHQAEPRCSERGQRGRYVRPSVASLVPSLNAAATSSSWFVS